MKALSRLSFFILHPLSFILKLLRLFMRRVFPAKTAKLLELEPLCRLLLVLVRNVITVFAIAAL